MRFALIIYGSIDTISGGYLYDRRLVQHLRNSGHSVEIVSLPWRSYPAHLADNLSHRWRERLAALNVDIIIQDELNHPSLAWVNGWLDSIGACPLVSIVHHLRSSENHPALPLLLYRWVERRYLRSVDGFIFNSATTKASVEQMADSQRKDAEGQRRRASDCEVAEGQGRKSFGVQPSVIAFPAADHIGAPDSTWLHEKLRVCSQSNAPLRLIFVGNVIERKGLHHVLDALVHLPANDATLTVVGNLDVAPAYVARVQRQITQLGLQRRVWLHGSLTQKALRECLRTSDLFVAPSYEGFGIVYLEAMAFGLPVIASTAGAAHEIVQPGQNGFLVQPGDTDALATYIHTLAQNRTLLTELALAARSRFDCHPTWTQTCERIESWLKQLIEH
jgi:glycosyltransferase involved in cell wall biosynthesis